MACQLDLAEGFPSPLGETSTERTLILAFQKIDPHRLAGTHFCFLFFFPWQWHGAPFSLFMPVGSQRSQSLSART
jgi:hypothetical protein